MVEIESFWVEKACIFFNQAQLYFAWLAHGVDDS